MPMVGDRADGDNAMKTRTSKLGAILGVMLLAVSAMLLFFWLSDVEVQFEIAGKPFGIGREPWLNAFGHQPDPQIELRLGDLRVPLWRSDRPCDCSMCKALEKLRRSERQQRVADEPR